MLILSIKLVQKGHLRSKTEKVNNTIEIYIFEIVWAPNFSLNWIFDFLDKIYPKMVFLVKNQKSEQRHWILHIRTRLANKVQLKLTILTFWTKFSRKGFFRSKIEKNEHWSWILHIRIGLGVRISL